VNDFYENKRALLLYLAVFLFGFVSCDIFFVTKVLASDKKSLINYETIFFDSLNKGGTIDFLEIKHNSGGQVDFVDKGVKMSASAGGASTLNFDFADIENEDIVISVEMFDDGNKKVSYAEVQGINGGNGVDARFYFGVIEDEVNTDGEYCLGNSIGDIKRLEKKRRCLSMGINRWPNRGKWVSVKFFVTKVGTYAVVNGVPSFVFGRSENQASLSGQTEGLFTPLKKINKFVIANKISEGSSSVLWRNLKIEKIRIDSDREEDYVFNVIDKYVGQNPQPFPDMFPNDLGLRFRYVADDLLVRAVEFLKSSDDAYLEYIKRVIVSIKNDFVSSVVEDAKDSNPLIRMRPGQAIYSLGMVYKLMNTSLDDESLSSLKMMVEGGVDVLFKDVKFGGGSYDCAVRQNPNILFDTRAEENVWKLKGLSVGLFMPGFDQKKRDQIKEAIDNCTKETFSYQADVNRPQFPGWNVNSNWTVSNHGYNPNPSYGVCSVVGNILDVDLAIDLAEEDGVENQDLNTMVVNMWNGHKYLMGLTNRNGDKYINQADFLFFPRIKKVGQSVFSYVATEKQLNKSQINWYRGIDDWGTSGRWCTSGVYMAEKSLKALGKEVFNDFENLILVNLYLQDVSITYPGDCYIGKDSRKDGYRCVYSLETMNNLQRKRGMDLKQAHRNAIVWLSMNGDWRSIQGIEIVQLVDWYKIYRSKGYENEVDFNNDGFVDINDLIFWYREYRKN